MQAIYMLNAVKQHAEEHGDKQLTHSDLITIINYAHELEQAAFDAEFKEANEQIARVNAILYGTRNNEQSDRS